MVICTYFLNNNCRFGNQCKKEHLDVRLIVKTDVDGVIKGNQWPLSTYGPFKDQPSIPHFIEDQSFEELRLAAYESKTNGTFATVAGQFSQSIADAKNRMGQLYELNHETLKVIVDLYNANASSSTGSNPNNPFSKVNTNTTSNVFGAKPAGNPSNPFATNTSNSPFGSSAASATPQTSSIFGGSSNVFGGNTTSVFGSSATSAPSVFASGSSVFGGASNSSMPSGIFSQSTSIASTQPASSNVFGASSFSGPASGGSIFGGAPSFGNSQPSNIFGGASQVASSTSIFGQSSFGGASAAAPAPTTNVFGAPQPATNSTNIFGAPAQANTVFGAPVSDASAQNPFGSAPSIFGAAQTQSTSIFGQPAASSVPSNPFGAPVQPPAFGSTAPASVFGQPTNQPPSAFGAAVPAESTGGVAFGSNYQSPFGAAQSQQTPVFGGTTAVPAPNAFNQTAAVVQSADVPGSNVYSQMESLSEAELAAFNAPTFDLTSIPTKPPPRQLCI